MRNWRALLGILLALMLVAASCGDSDGDSADEGDETTEETTGGDDSSDDDAGGGDEGSGDDDVDLTQGGDLTFHVITHSDDGPFWSVVQRGAEADRKSVV